MLKLTSAGSARALTETELERLLYVARYRPLAEYGRVSKPKDDVELSDKPAKVNRRNWTYAELAFDEINAAMDRARYRLRNSPHRIEQLDRLGRERALMYKTLIFTGLRRGELASLTIGQLHLAGPRPYVDLHAADEKNRQGAQIPLRSDLAGELASWVEDMQARNTRDSDANKGQSCHRLTTVARSTALPLTTPLFTVPKALVKILDRDLKLAGIAKRDEWGRTVDVHALRHCFGTLLSRSGVAPERRRLRCGIRRST